MAGKRAFDILESLSSSISQDVFDEIKAGLANNKIRHTSIFKLLKRLENREPITIIFSNADISTIKKALNLISTENITAKDIKEAIRVARETTTNPPTSSRTELCIYEGQDGELVVKFITITKKADKKQMRKVQII